MRLWRLPRRRWAWISVLALVAGPLAIYAIAVMGAPTEHALAAILICTLAAIAIPQRRIWPDHAGASTTEAAMKLLKYRGTRWPEFPARLAAGMVFVATGFAGVAALDTQLLAGWLALWMVAGLAAAMLVWAAKAEALQDLWAVPVAALIALVQLMAVQTAPLFADFVAAPQPGTVDRAGTDTGLDAPPAAFKPLASVLTAMMFVLAALIFWRSTARPPHRVRASLLWAVAAAFGPLLMIGALEIFWSPARVIGAYLWAGHAIAGAGLMTVLAERAARRWPADLRPSALYAMAALSLICFALIVVLTQAALSVALAVMIVIAAIIDRRFDMKLMGYFIQVGVAVLGWRIIIDPGVPWASWWNTPLWEVLVGVAVPIALLGAAWWILRPRRRSGAGLALESAVWSYGAVLALMLLERALRSGIDSFWGLSLAATVVLVSMGAQLYRWRRGRRLAWVRAGLAAVFGVIAAATYAVALVALSPLQRWSASEVKGPLLLDTIAVAYLVPAAVLAVLVWKLAHVPALLRRGFAGISAMMAAAYVGLEIRRFWQGSQMAGAEVSQGELYSCRPVGTTLGGTTRGAKRDDLAAAPLRAAGRCATGPHLAGCAPARSSTLMCAGRAGAAASLAAYIAASACWSRSHQL